MLDLYPELLYTEDLSPDVAGADVEAVCTGMKLKPFDTVAALIKKACAGFGTDELLLTKCLIRYQPILKQVNRAHVRLYEKSIQERLEEETGGDVCKILTEVLATGMAL